MRQVMGSLLSASVHVRIKRHIDGPGSTAQLAELARVQVRSQRAGNVVKSGLPHSGIVEQSFDQDEFGALPHLFEQVQAAFGTWQKPVRRRRSRNAAAIKIALQRNND